MLLSDTIKTNPQTMSGSPLFSLLPLKITGTINVEPHPVICKLISNLLMLIRTIVSALAIRRFILYANPIIARVTRKRYSIRTH